MGAKKSWYGGVPCATCSHRKAAAINAEMRAFHAARRKGEKMPWSVFIYERLRGAYGYTLSYAAAIKHAGRCLGIKLGRGR